MDWIVSIVGIGVFAGLTAYNNQRIKEMYDGREQDVSTGRKAVIGALSLYLNFINLFMMLLLLAGNRRYRIRLDVQAPEARASRAGWPIAEGLPSMPRGGMTAEGITAE